MEKIINSLKHCYKKKLMIFLTNKNILVLSNIYKKIILLILVTFQINFTFSQDQKITIKKIDSIFNIIDTQEYYNEKGIEKSLELYNESKKIGYKEGQVKSLRNLADIKLSNNLISEAYVHIQELKKFSLKNDDYANYVAAICLESKILFLDKNYEQAKKILNDSKKYLPYIKDNQSRINSKNNIDLFLWNAIKLSESPKKTYKEELIKISKEMCSDALLLENPATKYSKIMFAANYTSKILVELNRLEEAKKYLTLSAEHIQYTGAKSYNAIDYYDIKGDYEFKNKINNKLYLDSCLVHYNKALKYAEEEDYISLLKDLYPKIAKVYQLKNDLKKENEFLNKGNQLKNKIEKKENADLNKVKQKIYTLKEDNEIENANIKTTGIFFKILLSLLIIGLILIFRKKIIRLYLKNKYPLYKEEKNIKISENKLITVNKLLEILKENPSAFYLSFMEIYPDFSKKLLEINPSIKSSDVEFCALIKLNLETKQIASIKKLSVRAVEGKKYRIRKKLSISTEENMYIWMSKL